MAWFAYTVMTIVNTIFYILGSIDSDLVFWIWFFSFFLRYYGGALYTVEYFAVKFVSIVVMKQMLPIDDDFFSKFLMVANMSVAFVLSMTLGFSHFSETKHLMLRGLPEFININPSPVTDK